MKIISLNTWAGVALEPLMAFFKKYKGDADIFCLQEIYSNAEGVAEPHPRLDMKLDLFQRIEKVLSDTHKGYFRPVVGDYYGQAIFIRKDIQVNNEGDVLIYVNENPAGRGLHSRNLQYAEIDAGGKPMTIANIHGLWNGMGKTDTEDRLEQGRKVHNFISDHPKRIIVIGDFNLNPDTKSLAIMEQGMRNLIKEYHVASTRTSLYTKDDDKFADYALVSPDITVTDFRVLPDEVSDHAALYLELE